MTKAVYEAVSVVSSLSCTTTRCAAANPRRVRVQIAHRLSVPLLDFVYERLGSTPPRPAVLANYVNMLQAFTAKVRCAVCPCRSTCVRLRVCNRGGATRLFGVHRA